MRRPRSGAGGRERPADEILVVGSGGRFLSGISYHTAAIVRAFARAGGSVSGILGDRLCPRWLYPGRDNVGLHDNRALSLGSAPVASVDWWAVPSLPRAAWFLRRRRPRVVLVQWWTFATAPNFIVLAAVARLCGARLVLEAHEVNDPSETKIPGVRYLSRHAVQLLGRWCSAVVVHSNHDAEAMVAAFPELGGLPVRVIIPGPLEHGGKAAAPLERAADRGPGGVRYLFFGVLRDYKGLPELGEAFGRLIDEGHDVSLDVVGAPWQEVEDVLAHLDALGSQRVTIRRGYIPDGEVEAIYAAADVFVAPYRRSSASGPLNLALGYGLPVVVTEVPALLEACDGYEGAEVAAVGDQRSLADAMLRARKHVGRRFEGKTTWDGNVAAYRALFAEILRDS